ncbi:MAG: hypothetical protein ACLTL2_11570 [Blautia sp.]|uniref:hypothetical protein n=1 Tax=Blautia sp. TaxID=1955243 RepID=UPI00399654B2
MSEEIRNKESVFSINMEAKGNQGKGEEDPVLDMDYGEVMESQPCFFDAPEEKIRKEKMLSNLSETEAAEMQKMLKKVNDKSVHEEAPLLLPADIVDKIPSIFDSEQSFQSKYTEIADICAQMGYEIPKESNCLQPFSETHSKFNANIQTASANESAINRMLKQAVCVANDYIYRNGELIYIERDTQKETTIGNFCIKVLAEVINVKILVNEQNVTIGEKAETRWKVRIFCMEEIFEDILSASDLLNAKKMLSVTKDRGFLECDVSKLYRNYVKNIIGERKYDKKFFVKSTGWTKISDERWVYITDKGIIGEKTDTYRADVPYRFEYDEAKVGSMEIFQEFLGLKSLCPGRPENAVFLMHYAVLATMTTLFQEAGHGINFVVALIGATNSQKTSCGIIFTRLFDRTPKAIPDIRFNSTEVAILEKMESYGDAILMVDDLLPLEEKSAANEQQRKSETIIRSYGDRVARKRSRAYAERYNTDEYSPVKGCCLMTGEILNTSSESSATRVIQLKFERGDVDLKTLDFYQKNLMNFPTFLYDFISFVQKNVEKVQTTIQEQLARIRGIGIEDIQTPRFKDSLGIMAAEVEIFYRYAVARGFMEQRDAEVLQMNDLYFIHKIIAENDINAKIQSPAAVICLALEEGLKKGIVKMYKEEDCLEIKDIEKTVVNCEEYICIYPRSLWKLYKRYCQEIKKEIVYKNGRELVAPLKKENVIMIKKEGDNDRATHKIKSKTGSRFFYIKKSVFTTICGIFEEF